MNIKCYDYGNKVADRYTEMMFDFEVEVVDLETDCMICKEYMTGKGASQAEAEDDVLFYYLTDLYFMEDVYFIFSLKEVHHE